MPFGTVYHDMRPDCEYDGIELYECFKCGALVTAAGTCECGGALRHVGRSRDL